MFDYRNDIDSASKSWPRDNELGRINPGIFARNALARSWVFHIAENMSKEWRCDTSLPMKGTIGKTDYPVIYRSN